MEFGEINVRNATSENTREVDTKPPKILVECNGYPEMFSLSGAVESFRRYLLIRTDILQKTVDGCPWTPLIKIFSSGSKNLTNTYLSYFVPISVSQRKLALKRSFLHREKFSINVPLWFVVIPLVFFYLSKLLFSG